MSFTGSRRVRRVTRGEFLRVAAGAAGLLVLPARARGVQGTAAHAFQLFRSRPDLRPPAVRVTPGLPGDAITGSAPDNDTYWFLGPQSGSGSQSGPMIVDSSGALVWFKPAKPGRWATNFMVQQYRGEPVLTWWEGTLVNPPGYGYGEGVILDRSYREVARVRAGRGRRADLHEFRLTPQGTALITCYPPTLHRDLLPVGGPRNGPLLESVIQEVDVRSGRLLLEWRSLEHVPVSESYATRGGSYDYLHANSIVVLPDDNLLVSARHTWALYKLRRRDGRVIWRLGGKRSDFRLAPGARFSWQHDARHLSHNTITLFDDGAGDGQTESQSRGIVLELDQARRTARLVRSYRHPHPLLAYAMGSMQSLGDGNVVIGWGSIPVASEFDANGSLIAELHLGGGQASYRGVRFPWSGTPTDVPAVAVVRGSAGGSSTLYVSWNGATAVAGWQLSTGSSPESLEPVGVAPRTGFETAIAIPVTGGYAVVAALDAAGRPLASSRTISLG